MFRFKYHLVWCPKCRRPVLVKPVDSRLKALLRQKAEELEMTIHALEVIPDCLHLFVELDLRLCLAKIVNRLKGFTSYALREEFPFLRSPLLAPWSRSYYAGSVSSVSEAVVRKYMES